MPRLSRFFAVFVFAAAVAMAFFLPAMTAYGVSDDAVNLLPLENQMEEKLRSVLVEITGSDRVIVLVSAERRSESRQKVKDAVMLPGVPVKKEAGQEHADAQAFKSALGKLALKKLSVTILLDTGVSDSVKAIVTDVSATVLGLNKARGDEVSIKQIDFKGKGIAWSSILLPTNLAVLILSLIGSFFLATAALFLRNPFQKLGEALKGMGFGNSTAAGGSEKSIEVQNVFTGPTPGHGNPDPQQPVGVDLPFSFVQERHLANLAFLLKDKSAQDVAIVVNFIGAELANKFLEYFPEEKRIEVAMSLSTVDINPDKTRALEVKIREDLDYVVGGERKLASLLDAADEDVREKIFARLEKKDAEIARRMRQQIRDFESFLRDMPASGISLLYRQVDAALFAQLLKAVPEDIQQKVFGSLSAGAGERLKQEIDMSRPLSPARVKKEKQNVIAIIRRLIKEGSVEVENN